MKNEYPQRVCSGMYSAADTVLLEAWQSWMCSLLLPLVVSGKEQVSATGWAWRPTGPTEPHPALVIPTSFRALNASVERKWCMYTRAAIRSWLFYKPIEGKPPDSSHCWTDMCRNQAGTGFKSVENFLYYLPYDDEKWNKDSESFSSLHIQNVYFFSSTKPGDCLSPTPSALPAHTMLSVCTDMQAMGIWSSCQCTKAKLEV